LISRARDGEELTADEVAAVAGFLYTPSNRHWRQKLDVLRLIRGMRLSEEARRFCVGPVRELADPVNLARDAPGRLMRAGLRTVFIMTLGLAAVETSARAEPVWMIPLLVVALPVFLVSLAMESMHLREIRAEAARTLGALRDPDSLAVLISCARDLSAEVRRAGTEGLPQNLHDLPPVRPNLAPADYAKLIALLGSSEEIVVLSVLDALEKFDEGEAIQGVQRLVKRGATREIRAEAERILPILKDRQRRAQDPALLVRPAGPPEDAPEELLRPAWGVADEDPSTLLRAERAGPD
jgi:hypothetical protein